MKNANIVEKSYNIGKVDMPINNLDYTYSKLKSLFGFEVEKTSIFHAASTSKIPEPRLKRTKDGRVRAKYWTVEELPQIGKIYGFLSQPKKRNIICVYTPKGGVLKTTFTHNFARILALHGIKTLIVGLDVQCNVTGLTLGSKAQDSIDDIKELEHMAKKRGVMHIVNSRRDDLNPLDAIKTTDIPTLDIVEETHELAQLSKSMVVTTKAENLFKKNVISVLDAAMEEQGIPKYDVIIFDNGPSWTPITEASLYASNIIISPVGCDVESYRSVNTNLELINQFKENADISWWDEFILIPTLYERTNISKQILKAYRKNDSNDQVIDYQISAASAGQKAAMNNLSVIEHAPKESLANEYRDVIEEIWNDRINR
jgi:chromosome partitioning protein